MILHFRPFLSRNWVNGLLGFLGFAPPNSCSNLREKERERDRRGRKKAEREGKGGAERGEVESGPYTSTTGGGQMVGWSLV
jgi:hypothetical protein